MSVSTKSVSDRVSLLMHDAASILWRPEERLMWINDGRRAIARKDPGHFGDTVEVAHELTSGSRQRVNTRVPPGAGAFKVASVDYNVASGQAIRVTTKDQLDAFKPTWRKDKGANVQNWIPEDIDPLAFWVYPATSAPLIDPGDGIYIGEVPTTHTIMLRLFMLPESVASISDGVVALPNEKYLPALVNYVCFRMKSKPAQETYDQAAAIAYMQAFDAEMKG